MRALRRITHTILVTTAVATLAGCQIGEKKEALARAEAAEARLTQMDLLAAAKDSMMREMMTTTSFISEINDELARVKPAKGEKTVTYEERVMSVTEYRANLLERIRALTARLDSSEQKLTSSQSRLRVMAKADRDMTAKIVAFDSMVTSYKAVVEEQRSQIELLTAQVQTLEADNQRLAGEREVLTQEKTALTEQVGDLTTFANTVYYISGTKDELIKKGVVTEAGGSRVMGIGWRTGKTLVPAREQQTALFQTLNKTTDMEIAFPKPDKKYAIVSPQNIKFVEPAPAKDGTFKGSIKITDQAAFWEQSKFLIVVER